MAESWLETLKELYSKELDEVRDTLIYFHTAVKYNLQTEEPNDENVENIRIQDKIIEYYTNVQNKKHIFNMTNEEKELYFAP